jgi:hypothetical protein
LTTPRSFVQETCRRDQARARIDGVRIETCAPDREHVGTTSSRARLTHGPRERDARAKLGQLTRSESSRLALAALGAGEEEVRARWLRHYDALNKGERELHRPA